MQILNSLIKKLIDDNAIKFAYIEKPLNERFDDIHLHFICDFHPNEVDDYCLRIKSYLESEVFLSFYHDYNCSYLNNTDTMKTIHCVSDDGLSLYIYLDSKMKKYLNKVVLYDKLTPIEYSQLENKELVQTTLFMIDELHNVYQFMKAKEDILALLSLNKVTNHLFHFLNCYYLENSNNHSFNELIDKMDIDKKNAYMKIISFLKIEYIYECTKLLVWFIDDYIQTLPITIAKDIDIDYYLYVKGLILNKKIN